MRPHHIIQIARCLFSFVPMAVFIGAGLAPYSASGQCPDVWQAAIGNPGVNGTVRAVAVMANGDIVVGGAFSSVGNGIVANNIARYSASTGNWSALGLGVDALVSAIVVLPGGDLIAAGMFGSAGGLPASRIARCNPNTGVWTSTGTGANNNILSLSLLPNGDVIVGGLFTQINGLPASRIARYSPTTTLWSALGAGTSGTVRATVVMPDGDLIVAGDFLTAGVVNATRVARYNPTTAVWSALGAGGAGVNDSVITLALLPDGDVLAGGLFTTAGGTPANRIARYNPISMSWSEMGGGVPGGGVNNDVTSVIVLATGEAIAAGSFTTAGGVAASRIARYTPTSPTTGGWSSVAGGVNTTAFALARLSNNDVVVGGGFTTAGGASANRVARFSPGAPAPAISTQPLPVVTAPAGSALFAVIAQGGFGSGAPTYQWRKDGVAINTVSNPSAATPVLSIAHVEPADLGSYDCVVTNSCGGIGTASNTASLEFAAPDCNVDFNGDGFVDGFDYDDYVTAFENGC